MRSGQELGHVGARVDDVDVFPTSFLPSALAFSRHVGVLASSLAAVDWDICLIDTDVRTILSVLQDGGDRTYAGRSNSTPAGKAFLQSQVDGLMKEKAKYKEKRMHLVQRQQELEAAAEAAAPEAAGAAGDEEPKPDTEKAASLPSQTTPARRPSFPLGARPSPGALQRVSGVGERAADPG